MRVLVAVAVAALAAATSGISAGHASLRRVGSAGVTIALPAAGMRGFHRRA